MELRRLRAHAECRCDSSTRCCARFRREQVFAQTLLGFETVEQAIEQGSDDWVGINFVQPEDYMVAMRDYTLHMKMVEYLHGLYPKVHITLHAGELAPGMVPPEGMKFHIRQAVETRARGADRARR